MHLLDKISIKARLFIASSVTIVFIIIFSFVLFTNVGDILSITNTIYQHPLQVTNAELETKADIIEISKNLNDIVSADNQLEIDKYVDKITQIEQNAYTNIYLVRDNILNDDGKKLAADTIALIDAYKPLRQQVLDLTIAGKKDEAKKIADTRVSEQTEKITTNVERLYTISSNVANNLITNANNTGNNVRSILIIGLISFIVFFLILTIIMTISIIGVINYLKNRMSIITATKKLEKVKVPGKNEIVEMGMSFNALIDMLRDEAWLKDNMNILQTSLSKLSLRKEIAKTAINLIAEATKSAKGAIYIFDLKKHNLKLFSSYAFVESEHLRTEFNMGEGIVGQVALQKTPILLKNINKIEDIIETGTTRQVPLTTYTHPIIYKGILFGVIEVASFEMYSNLILDYIKKSSYDIAIFLENSEKNEKIKNLLSQTEEANYKLKNQSFELQQLNSVLEERQDELESQTIELRQMNIELEEQQEKLEETGSTLKERNAKLNMMSKNLEQNNAELQLSNKYKSEFLANISHELRTPLNSIILLSRLLSKNKNGNLNFDDIKKSDIINNAGNELLKLINNILDLSKIERGKIEIVEEKVSTKDLLDRFDAMYRPLADDKKLNFILIDEFNAELVTDKDKLIQIITNLISNAIKFTSYGEVELKISESSNDKLPVKISVRDTGIGISNDKQEIVFDEFKQVDGSISRKYGGTGLGLAIAKNLTKNLLGEIELTSVEGKGSTFSIYLPLSIEKVNVPNTKNEVALASNLEQAKQQDDENNFKQNDKLILIIEDDSHFVETLKEYINEMGFKMISANDGKSGIKKSIKYKPQGIILDLGLPDIDGIDVLKRLKLNPETRSIPVHILSCEDDGFKNELRKQGAIGFTTKSPIISQDIKEAISSILTVSEKVPKYLLIVEDQEGEKIALKEMMQDKIIQVNAVSTVTEAISEIKKDIYDAVIVDLYLKDEYGIDVCKFVKENNIELPIIIYTARQLTDTEIRELKKYSDSIVLKTANSHGRLMEEVSIFLHKVKKDKDQIELKLKNNGQFENKKILICDDDIKNIYSLSSVLEDFKFQIIEAYNGKEALERLEENPDVDLILMDIMMPVMDGLEAIEQIRMQSRFKEVPIIAVTAKAMKGDRELFMAKGTNDYISKPIDYDILLNLIKIWLK